MRSYIANYVLLFIFFKSFHLIWGGSKGLGRTTEKNQTCPCGNFYDTPSLKLVKTKGSIGHAFTVCIHTKNKNQVSFYPFFLCEISVLIELNLGHLRYHLTILPP